MENFGGDKFFKVRLYLCSPLDSHNKYPIKTFLSKHSLLASIHQKFLKPQFFLIHMLRLLDKNSAHLIFCKLLQLRIIPKLRSKFPKVRRNQTSSIFFFIKGIDEQFPRSRLQLRLPQHAVYSILMAEDGKEISHYLYAGWHALRIHTLEDTWTTTVSASTYLGLSPRYHGGRHSKFMEFHADRVRRRLDRSSMP